MEGITHEQAEYFMRGVLARHDLPQPDEVEYWATSIALRWDSTKTVIVIDLVEDLIDPEDDLPLP